MTSLSIVIPAYNEAASVETTVREALAVGGGVTQTLEVVVVNDGSSDETGAILSRLAAEDARVRVIHRRRNRGIEASIRALYATARHEWVFLMSADRQWPMTSLLDLAAAARDAGADLVVGVRRDKRAVYTPYRQILSRTYERVVRALGSPAGDPGSIKLGRAELLRVPIASRGVFSEGERLVRLGRQGHRIVECPVDFSRRRAGKAMGARPKVVAAAALDVLRTAASLAVGWPVAESPRKDREDKG